jgi:hypothetical protein
MTTRVLLPLDGDDVVDAKDDLEDRQGDERDQTGRSEE